MTEVKKVSVAGICFPTHDAKEPYVYCGGHDDPVEADRTKIYLSDGSLLGHVTKAVISAEVGGVLRYEIHGIVSPCPDKGEDA